MLRLVGVGSATSTQVPPSSLRRSSYAATPVPISAAAGQLTVTRHGVRLDRCAEPQARDRWERQRRDRVGVDGHGRRRGALADRRRCGRVSRIDGSECAVAAERARSPGHRPGDGYARDAHAVPRGIDTSCLERDRLADKHMSFARPDDDVGEWTRRDRRDDEQGVIDRILISVRWPVHQGRLDITRSAHERGGGAPAVEHDRLLSALVDEQARELGGGDADAVAVPSTVDGHECQGSVGAEGDCRPRVRRGGEVGDRPNALVGAFHQPLAAADRLEHALPPGGDRGPDRDGRALDEVGQDGGVDALGGQDQRSSGDHGVAACRPDGRDRGCPRAARAKRESRTGEHDLGAARERVGRSAPTSCIEDEVAAPARLVDAVDGQGRRAIGQGDGRPDQDVAQPRVLSRVEPERGLRRRGPGDELTEVDLEPARRPGRCGIWPEDIAIDRGDDSVAVA